MRKLIQAKTTHRCDYNNLREIAEGRGMRHKTGTSRCLDFSEMMESNDRAHLWQMLVNRRCQSTGEGHGDCQ